MLHFYNERFISIPYIRIHVYSRNKPPLSITHPNLVKNGTIAKTMHWVSTLTKITYGSGRKGLVDNKFGHEWQPLFLIEQMGQSGCPVCARSKGFSLDLMICY